MIAVKKTESLLTFVVAWGGFAGEKKRFNFSAIAQLAMIGPQTGVANILGINFSGFIAWWLRRTIYLFKLPRFEKKIRVALDWTLDLIFSKEPHSVSGYPQPRGFAPRGTSVAEIPDPATPSVGASSVTLGTLTWLE